MASQVDASFPYMDFRWLAATCIHFEHDQICTQVHVDASFSPFGHPSCCLCEVLNGSTRKRFLCISCVLSSKLVTVCPPKSSVCLWMISNNAIFNFTQVESWAVYSKTKDSTVWILTFNVFGSKCVRLTRLSRQKISHFCTWTPCPSIIVKLVRHFRNLVGQCPMTMLFPALFSHTVPLESIDPLGRGNSSSLLKGSAENSLRCD